MPVDVPCLPESSARELNHPQCSRATTPGDSQEITTPSRKRVGDMENEKEKRTEERKAHTDIWAKIRTRQDTDTEIILNLSDNLDRIVDC